MNSTLLIVWIFTWIAMAIMTTRLIFAKVSKRKFSTGEYLTVGAMLCALIRLALIDVVLIWGNNDIPAEYRKTHTFTAEEIYHREVGSKMTIGNRFFYNSYLWLQKLVLLEYYRGLIRNLSWERINIISYLFVFGATYITVQIITFTECNPFNHYWIVVPDPGKCTEAQVQLIVLGVLNIITDVMLIVMPIPVLMRSRLQRSLSQKIQIYILFSLGIFIVVITMIRLPQNLIQGTQINRTTWASAELLVSSIVANAPALYTLIKQRRTPVPDTVGRSSSYRRRQGRPLPPNLSATFDEQTMDLGTVGQYNTRDTRPFDESSQTGIVVVSD